MAESFPAPELVKRRSFLAELANEGKRSSLGAVFDILDNGPCMEEIFASNRELDLLWRQALATSLAGTSSETAIETPAPADRTDPDGTGC